MTWITSRKAKNMKKSNTTNELFKVSAAQNNASYLNYLDRLINLALSLFEWHNLPETIDGRFLEIQLLTKGYCLFFNDEIIGYLALPCMIGGELNVYNIPVRRTAYASNGYQNEKTEKNSVIIYNNMLRTNEYPLLEYYAMRLWNLDRIIDINANAQKTPILISCDEKQRLTLKNLYAKYDGNQPFIFGDKSLTSGIIQAINTGAPYVADRLYQLRTNIYNEALTFIGVSNISYTKKERMIRDEIQQLNAGTINGRYSRLMARKQACNEINKMFNLNINVTIREENEHGQVYNGSADDMQGNMQTEEHNTGND